MPGPAVLFREIHRLRRFARDLQEQIDRIPSRLKARKGRVAREEDAAQENQEAIKQLKMTLHEKEVGLKGTQALVAKHRRQLQESSSKKEYDALKSEIAQEEGRCGKFEEELLQVMDETDQRNARIPELEQAVRQAHEAYAAFEKEMEQRRADLASQLQEAEQQLREAEVHIPEDARTPYQRVVSIHGPDGLAPLRGRTCSACYTEITAQNYNDLLQERFILCKACGRILYIPEAG
jgi:predicted  nucleic acid-binding Zn-ribbon protein